MVKINHFDIIKILITLICTGLGAGLPDGILSFLAAINVLTIGIIHGANDLYIVSKIRKIERTTNKKLSLVSCSPMIQNPENAIS